MISVLVFSCFLSVAALLLAEQRRSETGKRLAKPLASTLFVAIAVVGGATGHPYGVAVILALVFSWFGDVLLLPAGAGTAFRLGAASFLVGHLAFAAAFLIRGIDPLAAVAAGVAVFVAAVVVRRWLDPKVPDAMRSLVRAYVAVISVMLVLAFGTFAEGGDLRIAVGAAMFYVSDLSVARDRFVEPTFSNRLWGLPLYYGGQILLALSATGSAAFG